MSNEKSIKVSDINYAIYKIGDWKNNYKINQIGVSREIPVTKSTVLHVKMSIDEIRSSEFDFSNKTVNGFVAIALHLNPEMQEMDLDDVVKLEEEEFEKITQELDNLELLDENSSVDANGSDYLIYKLEKEHHMVKSIPINEFTQKYYMDEIKKIEDALS